MTKTVLLATAAVLALSVGGASAATQNHPTAAFKGAANRHHMTSHGSAAVLYDQNSDDSGIGISSQNFESSFDQYDNQAADDFKVTKGATWKVSEVDVTGVYYGCTVCGPASSENVTFYKKGKKHLPGTQLKTFTVDGVDDGFGSFAMTLPGKGQKLTKGTYWVSVQASLDFLTGGQWGWESRVGVNGAKAAWQNPGNGFGSGCVTWGEEDVCAPNGQGDHMFTIRGTN